MNPIEFSESADSEWSFIIEHDRRLAEAIDPVLDQIENGTIPGAMFENRARFTTVRVPGRDELYAIIWEVRSDHHFMLRIGRVGT